MYNYHNFHKNRKVVALGYDQKKDQAPKIVASCSGKLAQKILEIAKEHNIPLYNDPDLVETLSLLEINEYIPLEIYSIVAEILNYIYSKDKP